MYGASHCEYKLTSNCLFEVFRFLSCFSILKPIQNHHLYTTNSTYIHTTLKYKYSSFQ